MERASAQNLCKQFREENIVCPPALRKGLYTVAAIDNIDHNPSSTTAIGFLHGTAIRIMQHVTMENPGETRGIQFHKGPFENEPFLPDDFAIVPAVSLNHADVFVPKVKIKENKVTLKRELIREKNEGRICMQTVRSGTCLEPQHCHMGSISCISTATVGENPNHYCFTATVF